MRLNRMTCAGFTVLLVSLAGCSTAPKQEAKEGGPDAAAESGAAPASREAAPPPAPAPKVRTVVIDAGTKLRVRTIDRLSTKTARAGQTFAATLAEPLVIDGVAVATKGAAVTGVVSESDPGGRVKGRATIAVRLTRLQLSDGNEVDIQSGVVVYRARGTKKRDATRIGIGSGIGAAIGAIAGGGQGAAIGAAAGGGAGTGVVMATRGDPAVIASESVLTFQLRTPLEVKMSS